MVPLPYVILCPYKNGNFPPNVLFITIFFYTVSYQVSLITFGLVSLNAYPRIVIPTTYSYDIDFLK